MPKNVIAYAIAGAGKLTLPTLPRTVPSSNSVPATLESKRVENLGRGNKIYSVHIAPDIAAVREHRRRDGFCAHASAPETRWTVPLTAAA